MIAHKVGIESVGGITQCCQVVLVHYLLVLCKCWCVVHSQSEQMHSTLNPNFSNHWCIKSTGNRMCLQSVGLQHDMHISITNSVVGW